MLSESTTEIIRKSFEELGLGIEHSKVYLASLYLGMSPASLIAKKALLPRSTTYGLLNDLTKLGLISAVKEETKLIYSPTSPEHLEFLLREKKNHLQSNIEKLENNLQPLLNTFSEHQSKFPKVRFHEGEIGLKTVLYDCLSADELLVICQGSVSFPEDDSLENEPQYLKDFIFQSQIRKLKTREILQDCPSAQEYKQKYESNFDQIIIIPENKENKFDHVDKQIYGNKIAYISHDNLIGVIIEDETLAAHERAQFEILWKFYKNQK
jgi:sugar-specific transcriptional regulator TrmB